MCEKRTQLKKKGKRENAKKKREKKREKERVKEKDAVNSRFNGLMTEQVFQKTSQGLQI